MKERSLNSFGKKPTSSRVVGRNGTTPQILGAEGVVGDAQAGPK